MADRTARPLDGVSVLIVDDNQDAKLVREISQLVEAR